MIIIKLTLIMAVEDKLPCLLTCVLHAGFILGGD